MKIAVPANGSTLDAEVDHRFGRCRHFIIADSDTMDFEVVENSNAGVAGGAGISAGQAVANKGVGVVLTGNCGPNAYQVLSSAHIKVVTGASGKVRDAIRSYNSGNFRPSTQASVPNHHGTAGSMDKSVATGRGMDRWKNVVRGKSK
jgi:predicted Fe-Mo cluster-binding NifX family protein